MSKFYTSVAQIRNSIHVRGYDNGKRIDKKIEYRPYLFVNNGGQEQGFRTLEGQEVGKVNFDSIKDARDFVQQYKDVDGFKIYGLDKFVYTYIYDTYKNNKDIVYDTSLITIGTIDIEVSIADGLGFPDIQAANNPITLITVSKHGKKYVFGCRPFINKDPINVEYELCSNEIELLQKFLRVWKELDLDVITGWNVEFFDMPYIINRLTNLLGKEYAQRISPWGVLQERTVEIMGRENQVYMPLGITTLDYMQLYKKFAGKQQETYKLDHIAQEELGEKKLEYEGTLKELEINNWQKYVEYNIQDVVLVERLDDKLKLIDLVFAMAYDAGVTYQDTFTTVNLWDVIIHNYLLDQKIVVPPFKRKAQDRQIVGGYVKEPQIGLHEWVISFDLTSLYPHIIMQYNISPETYRGRFPATFGVDDLIDGFFKKQQHIDFLLEKNFTVAANMCMFTREKQGFLPAIMSKLFDDRKRYKDRMLETQETYETSDKESESAIQMVKLIAQLDNLQQAKKIQLNSGYGALANLYFRWYETDFAEAITMSGQLSTKWIEVKLNEYMNKLFKTVGEDYVIAADTDSIYLKADKLALLKKDDSSITDWLDKVCKEAIIPFIDKKYVELGTSMNVFEQKMYMKRECIADRAIFIAKKRYVLNVYNQEGVTFLEPKLKIMGLEAIRTSTPYVCRDAIKKAVKITMTQTESDLQKFVADFKEEFIKMSFGQVAFPRGVSDMDKWADGKSIYKKGTPIHVRGALVHNHMLRQFDLEDKYEVLTNGSKVKFSYLKTPNPIQSNVITCTDRLPDEFMLDKYIDYEMQFEKTFVTPIVNIIDKIGWSIEERSSIEDFFTDDIVERNDRPDSGPSPDGPREPKDYRGVLDALYAGMTLALDRLEDDSN